MQEQIGIRSCKASLSQLCLWEIWKMGLVTHWRLLLIACVCQAEEPWGMFWCKCAQEPGVGSTQMVNETNLCRRDPLVWVFSLCRVPCCGVVWEVVHPHTSLLITTEHIFFCWKTKRSSWKTSVELRVHSAVKQSSRKCCRIPGEDVTFQQNSVSSKNILIYLTLKK